MNKEPDWEGDFWAIVEKYGDGAHIDFPMKLKSFIAEKIQEAEKRGREEAVELVEKYWTFDENQQHTHSWHDRADFLQVAKNLELQAQYRPRTSLDNQSAAKEL